MNRKYGRIKPASLPSHRMLLRIASGIPQSVDLRKYCGPVKNQGSLGSCTGHAFSSAIEWIFRRYFMYSPVLSPLYLYAKELQRQGDFPDDMGSTGTIGSEVAILDGCCDDQLYPDASQQIIAPTADMDAQAANYKMGAYHGLSGAITALSCLGDPVPWPVEVGFTVYASFESDETSDTGVYSPKPGEAILGGHEVLAVGYDIAPSPVFRPQGCPPAVLIQNSWGTTWGQEGFFWMPLSVLDDPDTDLKIIHSGHPWK